MGAMKSRDDGFGEGPKATCRLSAVSDANNAGGGLAAGATAGKCGATDLSTLAPTLPADGSACSYVRHCSYAALNLAKIGDDRHVSVSRSSLPNRQLSIKTTPLSWHHAP